MAKPKFIENSESLKLFLSIMKGNHKQSRIMEDIGLKKIKHRLESPTNITGKINSLIETGFIEKTGKNKGTRYNIKWEGLQRYIYTEFFNVSEEFKGSNEAIEKERKNFTKFLKEYFKLASKKTPHISLKTLLEQIIIEYAFLERKGVKLPVFHFNCYSYLKFKVVPVNAYRGLVKKLASTL